MTPILEIKNLKKNFKGFSLKDINIKLDSGYIMGFVGPNGSGKSTTIKLIMNLLKRDGGSINIFGMDNIKYERQIKNRIGFVFDENYFYEELTVNEMKMVIAPLYQEWDNNIFTKYVKKFELPLNKKIKELSKGMKMKYSLALALSHNPDLLIMDEPTSGLDPVVRNELLEILSYLIQDESKGIFFSTHITSDLDKVADYITFINNGEVLLSDEKDNIIDSYGLVKGGKDLLNSEMKRNLIGVKENKYGFEGLANDKKKIRSIFKDEVIIEKPSIEDIMLYFTRRDINV